MKTRNFPYLAGSMGAFLLLVVIFGSRSTDESSTVLPLLTLLIVNEFAFFVTAIGGFIGIRYMRSSRFHLRYGIVTALCLLLSAVFIWQGIKIWPW